MAAVFRWAAAAGLTMPARRCWSLAQQFRPSCRWSAVAHPTTARLDVGWARADQAVTAGTLEQVTDGEAASITPQQRRPTGRRSPRATRSHHGLGAGRVRPMRRPSDGGRVPVGRRCRVDDASSAVLVACAAIPAVLSLVRCGPPYDGPAGRRVGQSGPGSYGGHPRTSHRWRGGQHHAPAAAAHRETVTTGNTVASRIVRYVEWSQSGQIRQRRRKPGTRRPATPRSSNAAGSKFKLRTGRLQRDAFRPVLGVWASGSYPST